MDIMELGAIGELVGGLAVIGSLIYVGLQVRQNTRVEGASTHREMLEAAIQRHNVVMQIPDVVQAGLSDFQGLAHRDKLIFAGFITNYVTFFESVMHLHRKKLMDAVIFRAARDLVLRFILAPGGAQWWAYSKVLYDPRVREFLDQAIAEGADLPTPITSACPYYGSAQGA